MKAYIKYLSPDDFDAICTSWYLDTVGTSFYNNVPGFVQLAKLYNKELLCYEGGVNEASSTHAELYKPALDSLRSWGFSLVNQYTLIGNGINGNGAWALMSNTYEDTANCSKYKAVVSEISNCFVKTATTDTVGPGLSVHCLLYTSRCV